ncbi:MAG TPA: hypothetical protein DD435_14935 [Cyanobacteria bacterium UBA8530]|nr:hypothetical protein [Cyanobacteria bacterium UBA8530]
METFTGFFAPTDVAVDSQGNVFICESGKHRILKWDGLNAPALFAGSADGKPGRQDGIGSSARFDYPCGIAVDKAGNVFVADNANASIREISAEGEVTTVICPDRTESKSKEDNVSCPWDVAVDDFGNLFIADGDALKFFRGDFTVRLKDYAHSPFSLVAEKSGVFVVSYEDGAVTHVSAAGLTQDLVKKNDLFAHPNGIALAPDGKTLFVSDIASVPVNGQGAIRKIALN